MTLQICVLNRKRSFAISDSVVTIDECKTFDGEQKIFEISKELSTILLITGSSRLANQSINNFIDEYVSRTDFNEIDSVEEIRDTLNQSISSSLPSITSDEFVNSTFPEFEEDIKGFINQSDSESQSMEFLMQNAFHCDIDFLETNALMNSKSDKIDKFTV